MLFTLWRSYHNSGDNLYYASGGGGGGVLFDGYGPNASAGLSTSGQGQGGKGYGAGGGGSGWAGSNIPLGGNGAPGFVYLEWE